jgi:DNA polymerase elongation subunit (family B)
MYQNIYYQRRNNIMHIWDDVTGYRSFPHTKYAYVEDPNGEYTSIYGHRLSKTYDLSGDKDDYFEIDVPDTTRVLVDTYYNDDTPSVGHKIFTFDIEVEMDSGRPEPSKAENEITSIALHDSVTDDRWVLILDKQSLIKDSVDGNTTILSFKTERELLIKFLNIYNAISPTIITGWNIDNFDVPYLYNRLKRLFGDRTAGKLSPIGIVDYHTYRDRYYIAGVSAMDYLFLYRKFTMSELENYKLDTIGKKEVNMGKIEYEGSLDKLFNTNLEKFIEYNLRDIDIVIALDKKLQYIDLARSICHAGCVPYDEISYSSIYLEGAILADLKKDKMVTTNKPKRISKFGEDEDTFIGAFVKDPIVGKYKWIYDLDLTSLYPSIIMSLNISPETKLSKIINWDIELYTKGKLETLTFNNGKSMSLKNFKQYITEANLSVSSNGVLYTKGELGVIPRILDKWFSKRVEYRKLESEFGKKGDMEKYNFYNKRQTTQKILLNSLYGVLGLQSFRFFDIDNAEAVTTTGRDIILNTAKMINIKYNKELNVQGSDHTIYIDTDSCFFSAVPLLDKRYPNWKELDDNSIANLVDAIAGEMQNFVNSFYDIFCDKVFNIQNHRFQIKKEFISKAGIWLAKKRYAQWIISNNGVPMDKLDVKGLDVVRSSFPPAFRKFMAEILMDILIDKSIEFLSDKISDFRKKLPELGLQNIAKNTSVKEMSKYKIDNTQLFKFPAACPAHVKATIAYNQLLKHFKCGYKYEPFKDGSKVKWVYLKNNPYGLDGLAFNGDNEDPPKIIEFLNQYTDYDKIFERELLSKFQDIFDLMKWGLVINNKKNAEKFFDF